ncbi:hypothetical protein ACFQDF_24865 [Ectobacillus funiculus]
MGSIKPSEYDDVYSSEDRTDVAIFKRIVIKLIYHFGVNLFRWVDGHVAGVQ